MIVNKETIAELAKENKRLDNRALTEFRQPILVETNISWTAEGSARVQIGETVVMAGVKLSLEKPYNDTPDEGGIMVNAELSPIASPEFESGPPSIKAVELARVVDRGIREAKAIDLKKLCLVPGEKAWFVIVDIISLNDGGNLLDVAGMAALAALKTARFPVVDPETGAIDYKQKTDKSLPLTKEPLPITIYKVNGVLLVDPTNEEEKAYEARLTVGSDAKGTISALQKGGEVPLSITEIGKMVDLALEKASFLRKELNKALKA
ncbi:exosome complex protein Rrp42 [Candidatus Woesearchaeota archaeon]|nr:exosome complex protein Rrp42 [Candidatus Woesearchaeota archaeon]MBI2581499.1 exosome complex protein Rrp42 [Candidatus Woesearchaeota archaeon]